MSKTHVNIAHAGTEGYQKVLEQIARDGVCPFCVDFCGEGKPKYHTNPVLIDTKWWAVTENMRPYPGTMVQLLLVYKQHVLYPWEMPPEAWDDLRNVLKKIAESYTLSHGTFFMRFGETDFTGASVTHLHAQLIVGGAREAGTKPLIVYCGYQLK